MFEYYPFGHAIIVPLAFELFYSGMNDWLDFSNLEFMPRMKIYASLIIGSFAFYI